MMLQCAASSVSVPPDLLGGSPVGRKRGPIGIGVRPRMRAINNWNVPGFLYAIRRTGDGAVKIGLSADPTKRARGMNSQAKAKDCRLLGVLPVDDMGAREGQANQIYVAKWVGYEWYSLSDEDVAYFLTGEWMRSDKDLNACIAERIFTLAANRPFLRHYIRAHRKLLERGCPILPSCTDMLALRLTVEEMNIGKKTDTLCDRPWDHHFRGKIRVIRLVAAVNERERRAMWAEI